MFYGTERSIEDDDLDMDKPQPGISHSYLPPNNREIETGHNAVDKDGGDPWTGKQSDPWTGRQQLDQISHPEIQKPTTEDQMSGACNISNSHGCLGGCLLILLVLLPILTREPS